MASVPTPRRQPQPAAFGCRGDGWCRSAGDRRSRGLPATTANQVGIPDMPTWLAESLSFMPIACHNL